MEEVEKPSNQTSCLKKISLGQTFKEKNILLEEDNHCQTSKVAVKTIIDFEDRHGLNEEDEVHSVVSVKGSLKQQDSM